MTLQRYPFDSQANYSCEDFDYDAGQDVCDMVGEVEDTAGIGFAAETMVHQITSSPDAMTTAQYFDAAFNNDGSKLSTLDGVNRSSYPLEAFDECSTRASPPSNLGNSARRNTMQTKSLASGCPLTIDGGSCNPPFADTCRTMHTQSGNSSVVPSLKQRPTALRWQTGFSPARSKSTARGAEAQQQSTQSRSDKPLQRQSNDAAKQRASSTSGHNSRAAHCDAERRYRKNLVSQIELLRAHLPASSQLGASASADLEECGTPRSMSKAAVVSAAISYIETLESQQSQSMDQVDLMAKEVATLRSLVRCQDCSLLQHFAQVNLNVAASS